MKKTAGNVVKRLQGRWDAIGTAYSYVGDDGRVQIKGLPELIQMEKMARLNPNWTPTAHELSEPV